MSQTDSIRRLNSAADPDDPDDYVKPRYYFGAPGSLLAKIGDDERVFTIHATDEGVRIVEACDRYYSADLTKAELLQLIAELQQIADSL